MLFSIEVDESWLRVLEGLIEKVLDQPTSSPEEALEFSIFAQMRKQIIASKEKAPEGFDGSTQGHYTNEQRKYSQFTSNCQGG